MWTEKYRPKKLDEVKGQDDIIKRLKSFVKTRNMPHLLFSGPAGVGKTASSIALAREMFGKNWRDNILELNASDERGIDVVRVKVKEFARSKSIHDVPFKLVYLDEADALTKDAQHALRRTMENYATSTRFILACNYSSKIISPIQSRCAIFRFKPLAKKYVNDILNNIAKNEKLKINDKALDFIYEASAGDCRKAENIMQATAAITNDLDEKAVEQVVSFAEPKEIEAVVSLSLEGNFEKAKEKLANVMLNHGLSGEDVIAQIQKQIWQLKVPDKQKVELIRICGDYEFRLVEGSNEFIQLNSMIAKFALVGGEK
ncbi:MAG: replication factor C small subunit [Candidatus Heimdallarchaeota archaeon]|nr:replication factor C small subunit [Candidatus Heimdallarchaeota archaeon]